MASKGRPKKPRIYEIEGNTVRQTAETRSAAPVRSPAVRIDGNTVRPLEEPGIYEPRRRPEERRRIRRNREKALQMSPGFILFLAVSCAFVLAVSVNYLKVQASINARLTNITALEDDLEALRSVNEATQSRIAVATDIQQIYKIATEELGMVYPDDSQVIYYDRTEREYVAQYEDIPGE